MNRQKIYGLIISSALLIGAIGLPTTVTYAQTLPNHNINSTITTNSNSIKTENLTINFGNMFNWNAYLTNVNINVIVNGKTYTENYDYSGSLTINNVLVNKTGNNTIKIEIPYYNTITLNTNSNNITVNPVETPMTFDGNKALANAVANAIQASPNELTYYNLASYCYGVENNYGVAPLDINLSGQHLTTLNGIQQLKGFDINSLNLSNNNLTDISSLDGLTINNLDLSHNDITNLDSINKISNINTLNVNYNYISSLTPLEGIKSITSVTAQNNLLSQNPLSFGIKGLTSNGLNNNFIEGLSNQLQLKLKNSNYTGTVGSVINLTKNDVEIVNGALGTNETSYYSKYITLSNKNQNTLTQENNGFKINEVGTNYVLASVDGITNHLGEATATINGTQTTKTENLTINFGNMFNWNAYLTNVNINVIVNGKTYTENYDYSGSLTINNVLVNKTGNNTIKIEIPYYNTITLNTNSNNITVNPVETPMTFDGNKALANAVANAIQASPNELTYYNLASYCYGVENNYGVAPLDINLSGQHLTTLNGIQPLRGFDINSLNLSYNNLTDISALDGLTINNLDLSHNNITNIDSLANVSNLQSLNISANNVTSTKILSNINGLKITK